MSRVSLRTTLTVAGLVASSVLAIPSGAAAAANVTLAVSSTPDRSAPRALAGATVAGTVYVFTTPDDGVTRVSFWFDDPTRSGPPRRVEYAAPFDFAGTNGSLANGFDTRTLTDGAHRITAEAVVDGVATITDAAFTVSNGSPPTDAVTLRYSTSADRSGAQALHGATTAGVIYVFTAPDTGVTKVSFWLDDPSRSGSPRHVERSAPFDFAGTSGNVAKGFDTASVANGSHVITAEVVRSGGTEVTSATFTVSNTSGGAVDAYTYSAIPNIPFGSTEAQGVVIGERLYQFGGFDYNKPCCYPVDTAYRYDVATRTWTYLPAFPNGGVTHAGVATDGSNVFLAGGYVWNSDRTVQIFGSRAVWRYNIAAQTYSRLPDLPVERGSGNLAYHGGKLYFFGGQNLARDRDTPDLWSLDVAAGATAWRTLAPMPSARNHVGSAVYNGRIYLASGQQGYDSTAVLYNTLQVYDIATNTWSVKAPKPTAVSHTGSSTFVLDGRIVVAGGELQNYDPTAKVEVYNPATNTWSNITPMPVPRRSGVAGALANHRWIYAGGLNGDGRLATPA